MSLRVSVVLPCRNEVGWIVACLQSLLEQDFPRDDYEIIVVDGMSTDGTRVVLHEYATRHPAIRVVDNPEQITPVALNRGILTSQGEIIMVAGAHSRYDRWFLQRLIHYLAHFPEADAVGGVILARPRTVDTLGRASVSAIGHLFGVGPSYFRTHRKEPVWADTAFGCGYRRRVFEKTGLFNEGLVRGQDMEFNRRLVATGGRILLAPDLTSEYFARSSLGTFWAHNVTNGVWAILPFLYSPIHPVALRHLVPMGFVLSLLLATLGAIVFPPVAGLGLGLAAAYGAVTLLAAAHVAWRETDPLLFPLMLVMFPSLHVGYGIGSVWGAFCVLTRWLCGERRPSPTDAWPRLDSYPRRAAST